MNVFSRLIGRMCEFFRTHNFTCDVCGREVFENERICRTLDPSECSEDYFTTLIVKD